MTVAALRNTLHAIGLDLTPDDLADLLWLASLRTEPTSEPEPQQGTATVTAQPQSAHPPQWTTHAPTVDVEHPHQQPPAATQPPMADAAGTDLAVHLPHDRAGHERTAGVTALPIRVPAARALADAGGLLRALRPLKRPTPSMHRHAMDEQATAERVAEDGLWLPVVVPESERWLDLALVIDEGSSMVLWRQVIRELRQLLGQLGAFRDIRQWRLNTELGPVRTQVVLRGDAEGAQARDPGELVDPTGRRIVMIFSDCLGSGWRSGAMDRLLTRWGTSGPLVIVQPLPERLWHRTGLSPESVDVWTSRPGQANASMVGRQRRAQGARGAAVDGALPIPVLELDRQWIAPWAALVANTTSAWTSLAVQTVSDPPAVRSPTAVATAHKTAQQLIQEFRNSSSSAAFQLVCYLSAVPISLPVIRLVQHTMFRSPRPSHLAEVFLGGLLRRVTPDGEDVDADEVQYEFADGVQEILLGMITRSEALHVLTEVSDFLGAGLGTPVDFRAVLADPLGHSGAVLDRMSRPFATIARTVLARLGGKYAELAAQRDATPTAPAADATDTHNVVWHQHGADPGAITIDQSPGPADLYTRSTHSAAADMESPKLRPFLFVGVGGSGGATLRYLAQELTERLQLAGVARIPDGWQFLHIDAGSDAEFYQDAPGRRGAYFGLVPTGVTYQVIARHLESRSAAAQQAFLGWRADPAQVYVNVLRGAGQYRAIGRAAILSRLHALTNQIEKAVQRVETANMTEVTAHLTHGPAVGTQPNPIVVVVSSIAGGTGSGTVLDVCDILRATGKAWAADSVAILYTPDVFDGLRESLRRGVCANALAGISELLAAHWVSDPTQDPIYKDAGIEFHGQGPTGPAHPFLVGAQNDQLRFGNQHDVFAVVAKTLAAWATSHSIQEQLSSHIARTWHQTASMSDPLGLSDTPLDMPFAAFGHASLSLGRRRFGQYAAQCLASATVGRLLTGSGPGDDRVDVDEAVYQNRGAFGRAVLCLPEGHSLTGQEAAQVLPEVLAPDRQMALDRTKDIIRADLGIAPRSPEGWAGHLDRILSEQWSPFLQTRTNTLVQGVIRWVGQVQSNLRTEIARSLARNGLVITQRLVDYMVDYLLPEVQSTLAHAAVRDEDARRGYRSEIADALGHGEQRRFGRQRLLLAENEWVQTALSRGVEAALGRGADAEAKRVAAELVTAMAKDLLRPLRDMVALAVQGLKEDAGSLGARSRTIVDQWPTGPTFVPTATLRPGPTEFLIDPIEDYPRIFEEKMTNAVPDAEVLDDAVGVAVRSILTGAAEPSTTVTPIFEQTVAWIPRPVSTWSDRAPQPAVFHAHMKANDILARCVEWTRRAPALGDHLRDTLAAALGDAQPTPEHSNRLARYEAQFVRALRMSSPLVRLDPAYQFRYLQGDTAAYTPLISPIPLNPGTPAYERTRELLLQHSSIPEAMLDSLFGPTSTNDVEFTTLLSQTCHPIGFASLMGPIRRDWQGQRTHPGQRQVFGRWRRARPLSRFVPLPEKVRRQLIRGWLVNCVLHDSKPELVVDQIVALRLRINDSMPDPALFPLLGDIPDPQDTLDCIAAVLESCHLILVDPLDPTGSSVESFQRLLAVNTSRFDDLVHPTDKAVNTLRKLVAQVDREPGDNPPPQVFRVAELWADFRLVIRELLSEMVKPPG